MRWCCRKAASKVVSQPSEPCPLLTVTISPEGQKPVFPPHQVQELLSGYWANPHNPNPTSATLKATFFISMDFFPPPRNHVYAPITCFSQSFFNFVCTLCIIYTSFVFCVCVFVPVRLLQARFVIVPVPHCTRAYTINLRHVDKTTFLPLYCHQHTLMILQRSTGQMCQGLCQWEAAASEIHSGVVVREVVLPGCVLHHLAGR